MLLGKINTNYKSVLPFILAAAAASVSGAILLDVNEAPRLLLQNLIGSIILAISEHFKKVFDGDIRFVAKLIANDFVGIYTSFTCVVNLAALLWIKHNVMSAILFFILNFASSVIVYLLLRFLILPMVFGNTKRNDGSPRLGHHFKQSKIIYQTYIFSIVVIFLSYLRVYFFNPEITHEDEIIFLYPSPTELSFSIFMACVSVFVSHYGLPFPSAYGIDLTTILANCLSCWGVFLVHIVGFYTVLDLRWFENASWKYSTPFFSCWSGFNNLLMVVGKKVEKKQYRSLFYNVILNLSTGWLFVLAMKPLYHDLPDILFHN